MVLDFKLNVSHNGFHNTYTGKAGSFAELAKLWVQAAIKAEKEINE